MLLLPKFFYLDQKPKTFSKDQALKLKTIKDCQNKNTNFKNIETKKFFYNVKKQSNKKIPNGSTPGKRVSKSFFFLFGNPLTNFFHLSFWILSISSSVGLPMYSKMISIWSFAKKKNFLNFQIYSNFQFLWKTDVS